MVSVKGNLSFHARFGDELADAEKDVSMLVEGIEFERIGPEPRLLLQEIVPGMYEICPEGCIVTDVSVRKEIGSRVTRFPDYVHINACRLDPPLDVTIYLTSEAFHARGANL